MTKIDPTALYQLYIEEKRSIRSIAALLHVAPRTVYDAMIHARIPRRKMWEGYSTKVAIEARTSELSETMLRQLYLVEHHSIRELADILGTGTSTIYQALVQWNIPRRKRGRPVGRLAQ